MITCNFGSAKSKQTKIPVVLTAIDIFKALSILFNVQLTQNIRTHNKT